MATTPEAVRPAGETDYMPLHGIDHVELWVGNAAQASYYFRHAFGFREMAFSGLETGLRDRTSRVLQPKVPRRALSKNRNERNDWNAQRDRSVRPVPSTDLLPDISRSSCRANRSPSTGTCRASNLRLREPK